VFDGREEKLVKTGLTAILLAATQCWVSPALTNAAEPCFAAIRPSYELIGEDAETARVLLDGASWRMLPPAAFDRLRTKPHPKWRGVALVKAAKGTSPPALTIRQCGDTLLARDDLLCPNAKSEVTYVLVGVDEIPTQYVYSRRDSC
jgi:hypothetical protein